MTHRIGSGLVALCLSLLVALGGRGHAAKPSAHEPVSVGTAGCKPDAEGYCTGSIVYHDLSYERPDVDLRVNMTVGAALFIELPPELDVPKAPRSGTSLLVVDTKAWEADRHFIDYRFVSPAKPPPAEDGTPAQIKTLENSLSAKLAVFLEAPFRITVWVKLVAPEHAVSRLVLTCRESARMRSVLQTELERERQKLQAEYDARHKRLDEEVRARALRSLAEAQLQREWHCNTFPMRRMRAEYEFLTLFGRYLCRVGDYAVLGFRLVNNRADVFHLEKLRVLDQGKDTSAGWVFVNKKSVIEQGAEKMRLRYHTIAVLEQDEEILGTAYLDLGELRNTPSEFAIEVTEDGGRRRRVTLKNFDF